MKSRFCPSGENEIGEIPRSLATGIVNFKGFLYSPGYNGDSGLSVGRYFISSLLPTGLADLRRRG
jgi:hypothetical protein